MNKKKSLMVVEKNPDIKLPVIVTPDSDSHNIQSTHIRVYDDHATIVNPKVARPICVVKKRPLTKAEPAMSPIKLPPKKAPEKAIIAVQESTPCWKAAAFGRGVGLEEQIKDFMEEFNVKINPKKESLVYEPLRIEKVGPRSNDKMFYFINQDGRVDSVSLDFPHGYDIKQMIQEVIDTKTEFGFKPFIVVKKKWITDKEKDRLYAVRFIFDE